jgi:hypothetical protein
MLPAACILGGGNHGMLEAEWCIMCSSIGGDIPWMGGTTLCQVQTTVQRAHLQYRNNSKYRYVISGSIPERPSGIVPLKGHVF